MERSLLIAGLLLCSNVFAQKYSAKMELEPENAAKNEPIKMIITVNARPEGVTLPKLDDFTIIFVPNSPVINSYSEGSSGTNDNVEIVEAKYTYLLCAKEPGKYKIGNAVVKVNGKSVKTNSEKIKIEDRKVSWEDSAKVSEQYTHFQIGKGSTQTKTAIHYDNNAASKNTVQEDPVGTGVDKFEVTTQTKTVHVKRGEAFTVSYTIYREAPLADFTSEITIDAPAEMKGFSILEGPNKEMHAKANSVRKAATGTIEYKLRTDLPGKYTIPSMKVKYGDTVAISPEIEVVVE